MTVYRVQHKTLYEYEAPVMHSHHSLRLVPRTMQYQTVRRSLLTISPSPDIRHQHLDYFGNHAEYLEVFSAHDCFEVVATTVLDVVPRFVDEARLDTGIAWEEVALALQGPSVELRNQEYCYDSPLVRRHAILRDYAAPSFTPGRSMFAAVSELNQRIFDEFKYESSATDITTPLAQVMRERRGVCQDFAHVAIGCLRSLGLAARYVSGYMETFPPPGQPKLIGADASHAWLAVWFPQLGWLDFDPTNALLPNGRHLTTALGRDFSDVSPLKGVVLGGGRHQLSVSVDVAVDTATPPPQLVS